MAPSTAPFKVIIVGGGPVGLLTAHALHKAGIDFVLLERRDTCATHQGSSIGLAPPTMRVFDQLGLYDAIMAVNNKMITKYAVTDKGKRFYAADLGTWIADAHGHELCFIHRADLLDLLYNNLPDEAKAKVLTEKRISDIQSDETKAVITCEDGTSYEGSLVLGSDGVHSQVRGFMRKLALANDPKASVDEENPFLTTYRCLFGFTPAVADHTPGSAWEGHATDKCSQMFCGDERTWFFLYEKLEKPTREKRSYTRADEEQYLERLGDMHFSETVKARDAFKKTAQTVLVDLQEGTVRNYYYSRLLLAGDAANKQTPNAGNGFNCGVQDVVTLSTMLHALVKGPNGEDREEVDMTAIQALLGEYQTRRRPDAVGINSRSALMTRMSAFEKWQLWLMDRYLMPAFKLDKLAFDKVVSPAFAASDVLSYLPEHNLKQGTLPWKNMSAVQSIKV